MKSTCLIVLSAILQGCVAVCYVGGRDKPWNGFFVKSGLTAKAQQPWELEFLTDVDFWKIRDCKSAKMMVKLRHPNFEDGRPLTVFVECPTRSDLPYWIASGMIDGVNMGCFGWCATGNGNRTGMKIGRYRSRSDTEPPVEWEVSVDLRVADFPTYLDCERFLAAYAQRTAQIVAIDENGILVWMRCNKIIMGHLQVEISPLTINGERVPEELLRKYRRGKVEVL